MRRKRGLKKNKVHPGRTLFFAVKNNKPALVEKELRKGVAIDGGYKPWFESSPLVKGSKEGSTECVKLLIDAKAHLESRCRIGGTALYWAARNDHPRTLNLLILSGANKNPNDLYGEGPLHVAALRGRITTSKVLIVNNANINLRNKLGNTALHLAAERGHLELVKVLMHPPSSRLFDLTKQLILLFVPYLNVFMAREIAEFVAGHRANTALLNDKGLSAEEVAKRKFHRDVSKYLAKNRT